MIMKNGDTLHNRITRKRKDILYDIARQAFLKGGACLVFELSSECVGGFGGSAGVLLVFDTRNKLYGKRGDLDGRGTEIFQRQTMGHAFARHGNKASTTPQERVGHILHDATLHPDRYNFAYFSPQVLCLFEILENHTDTGVLFGGHGQRGQYRKGSKAYLDGLYLAKEIDHVVL